MGIKLLHTPKEVQTALGIGNSKFYYLVQEGRFDVRKMGNRTFITDESLRRFADSLPPAK